MTVFILDDATKQQLHALRDRGNANLIPLDTILKAQQAFDEGRPSYYLPPDQIVTLQMGWGVAYSREVHPGGEFRHLSISSPDTDKVPIPALCEMVMVEMDFEHGWSQCQISAEDLPNGGKAINIIEPYREMVA